MLQARDYVAANKYFYCLSREALNQDAVGFTRSVLRFLSAVVRSVQDETVVAQAVLDNSARLHLSPMMAYLASEYDRMEMPRPDIYFQAGVVLDLVALDSYLYHFQVFYQLFNLNL